MIMTENWPIIWSKPNLAGCGKILISTILAAFVPYYQRIHLMKPNEGKYLDIKKKPIPLKKIFEVVSPK